MVGKVGGGEKVREDGIIGGDEFMVKMERFVKMKRLEERRRRLNSQGKASQKAPEADRGWGHLLPTAKKEILSS
jgi:hypothetical protein